MNHIWILATADNAGQNIEGTEVGMVDDASSQETQTQTQKDGSNGAPAKEIVPLTPMQQMMKFAPFILIFIVMYLLMFRGPKKKQQEHQKMVSSLAKNDRVRTIGGIFGTVLDVRDNEVVLKIDESTNTKMRVSPSAIATVLKDGKDE